MKSHDNDDGLFSFRLATSLWFWAAVFAIAAIIVALIIASVRPTLLDLERDAVEHSRGYIESHQNQISQLIDEYLERELDIARLQSNPANQTTVNTLTTSLEFTHSQICELVDDIPESLSQSHQQFLSAHPC